MLVAALVPLATTSPTLSNAQDIAKAQLAAPANSFPLIPWGYATLRGPGANLGGPGSAAVGYSSTRTVGWSATKSI